MKSNPSKKSKKSPARSGGKARKAAKKAVKRRPPEDGLSPEARSRAAILDWAGPAFPLEVREEAALVFADYVRKGAGELTDFYMHPLQFGTGGLRGVIGNGAGRMNP